MPYPRFLLPPRFFGMMPTLCAISMALPSVYMVLLLAISAMVISDVRFADVFLLNAFLSPCPKGEGITLSLPGGRLQRLRGNLRVPLRQEERSEYMPSRYGWVQLFDFSSEDWRRRAESISERPRCDGKNEAELYALILLIS